MGGSSDDSSDSFSSSYDYDDSSTSDDSWSSPSSSSPSEKGNEAAATHESIGTAPVEISPAAKRRHDMVFFGCIALASAGAAALVKAALHHTPPRTTVVKLQVALRGVAAAKSFQKDLNEIAEKVDVKDYWNKISIEERSKFDEETLSNLDGIKRKKSYSRKTDGSKNEYIVLTILIAAEGALKLPVVRSSADLVAAVGKLNSIPAVEIRGIHVLWTPQQENDVLSEEEMEDYPCLTPLRHE
ncbi:hypothetical protein HU200_010194 [Digitaria exilis]|uniref:Uncharacterized protein n=1 Tax=Digitaria exilis TaxID=1010633 RepID=A0A835FIJ7_9POAL|nr:hypothetical protein HU200_010194 [Digitaria exilis]